MASEQIKTKHKGHTMLEKKLQTNFTIADNRIAQDKTLSYEARGLYFYMLSLPSDWDFSEQRLAKQGGIGIDKIKRILKELFSAGLLSRKFANNDKGYRKYIYTIYDYATLENPTLENPTLENPTLENPTTYKEIKENKENKENKEIKNTNTRAQENQIELISYTKQASKAQELKEQRADLFSPKSNDLHLNAQKHAFFSKSDFNPSDHISESDLKHLNAFFITLKDSSIASELKRELGLFILMRRDLGAKGKLTARGLRLILNKLESFKDTSTRKQALKNSVINNWLGVFNPQANKQSKESNQRNTYERPKPNDDEISEFERIAKERALNPQYTLDKAKGVDNDLPF